MPPLNKTTQGILWLVAACACFTLMDALAKQALNEIHIVQIVWARYVGQLFFVIAISSSVFLQIIKTNHPKIQIFRGLAQIGASICFFMALTSMAQADATAIFNIAPILITLGAAIFLGETLGWRRVIAVIIAFLGTLFIVRPGTESFQPAAIYAAMAAFFYASFAVATRFVGLREDPRTALFFAGLIGTLICSVFIIDYWINPSLLMWLVLFGITLSGTIGQYMLIRASVLAEASILAPYTYSGFLFAVFWGAIFTKDIPHMASWIGTLVIVGAGLYVWKRESQKSG